MLINLSRMEKAAVQNAHHEALSFTCQLASLSAKEVDHEQTVFSQDRKNRLFGMDGK